MEAKEKEILDILKLLYAKEATDAELLVFMNIARKLGLDPVAKEIVFIKRKIRKDRNEHYIPSYSITIDGYRKIAHRHEDYEGLTPTYWCDKNGNWTDVWLSQEPPIAAKVGVYRKKFREPIWVVVHYNAVVQTVRDELGNERPTIFWKKMPAEMLAKCAESLAYRKAFPVSFEESLGNRADYNVLDTQSTSAQLTGQSSDTSLPEIIFDALPHEADTATIEVSDTIVPEISEPPVLYADDSGMITPKQKSYLEQALINKQIDVDSFMKWAFGGTIHQLTKKQASAMIENLYKLIREYNSEQSNKIDDYVPF